jgi:regulator of cell morphogenesis and NO signaling
MPPDEPDSWTLTRLADHLKATDHRALKELAPRAAAYTRRIRDVHGAQHPEVERIAAASGELADALQAHLQREEEAFFPAVRRIEKARRQGAAVAPDDVKEIASSLAALRAEHERFLVTLDELRDLTMDYARPFDACASYDLAYRTLQELDGVIRRHLALEDEILLPKAQALIDGATGSPS